MIECSYDYLSLAPIIHISHTLILYPILTFGIVNIRKKIIFFTYVSFLIKALKFLERNFAVDIY